jgi:uncharacterized protein YkwD
MPTLPTVDIIVILFLLLYVLMQVRYGLFYLVTKLISFLGSVVLAFLTYHFLALALGAYIPLPPGVLDAVSFLILFLVYQGLIHLLLKRLLVSLPRTFDDSRPAKVLAVVPAFIDGLITVAVVLLIFMIMPFSSTLKAQVEDSVVARPLLDQAEKLEGYVDKVFGRAGEEALGFLTVKPDESETVALPFEPRRLTVSPEAEAKMLELLNEERTSRGLSPVTVDPTIVEVARAHSRDMWERKYFSHQNPDGEDPFDRMKEGEVSFRAAGENLALAHTVERAHRGLMNSEGHKRNLLDPAFKRIGIGAIDAGVYGIMFTQNFAD